MVPNVGSTTVPAASELYFIIEDRIGGGGWHIFRNGARKMNSATKWFLNRIVSNFMSSQTTSFLFFTKMRSILPACVKIKSTVQASFQKFTKFKFTNRQCWQCQILWPYSSRYFKFRPSTWQIKPNTFSKRWPKWWSWNANSIPWLWTNSTFRIFELHIL